MYALPASTASTLMDALNDLHRAVLAAIRRYQRIAGVTPTCGTLGRLVNVSRGHAHRLVHYLASVGALVITSQPGERLSAVLPPPPRQPLQLPPRRAATHRRSPPRLRSRRAQP